MGYLLPVVSSERPERAAAATPPVDPRVAEGLSLRRTILVADDQPTLRRSIVSVLEDAGLEVLEAGDGQAAVRVFEVEREHIGAVLLDVGMPRLNGTQAGAAIRALAPEVPVILMSGYLADEPPEGMLVLVKPFRVEELLATLERVLS